MKVTKAKLSAYHFHFNEVDNNSKLTFHGIVSKLTHV